MSDSIASLRRKIEGARDLRSVVSTMKAMAAASIGQYQRSTLALDDYYRAVQLGLSVCFRTGMLSPSVSPVTGREVNPWGNVTGAVVFGSDQGLVGRFNEVIADYAIQTLAALPGKTRVWVTGERVYDRLANTGMHVDLQVAGLFTVPLSVKGITPLVGRILMETLMPSLGPSWKKAKPGEQGATRMGSRSFISSTTVPGRERYMRLSISGCCRWTMSGGANWPEFPGRRTSCRR